MAAGGKRANSGPKKNPVTIREHEQNIADFQKEAVEALPQLLDTLQEMANGVRIVARHKPRSNEYVICESTKLEGEDVYIYTVPPNERALFFLIEHAKGKAAQQQQVQRDHTFIIESKVPRATPAPPAPELRVEDAKTGRSKRVTSLPDIDFNEK